MPRIYLDQVSLIRMGIPDASTEAQEVRRRIGNCDLTLVLSTAHWLDTAGGDSDGNSQLLSRFIDGLRPIWLKERIGLYRAEIRSFLEAVPFERLREDVICKTVTELVAEIVGLTGGGAAIVTTEDLVMHLRRNQGARDLFSRVYASNKEANRQNCKMFRAGQLTSEIEQRAQKLAFQKFGGVAAGSAEETRLRGAPPDATRSLVCEWKATKETWRQGLDMNPNRWRDLFHLVVAMPYTDVIVTSDQELRRTIAAVKAQVQFPVAQVVGSLKKLLGVANRKWARVHEMA